MIFSPLIDALAVKDLPDDTLFLDARAGSGVDLEYAARHVRGAIHVDLESDLSTPGDPRDGGRHPLPTWSAWLTQVGKWGIETTTPVVIYDASSGAMAAARAWWMLRAVGHQQVAVVDGGLAALEAADIAMDSQRPNIHPKPAYPSSNTGWRVVDAELVARVSNDPRWKLVDARAPERFRGETEPIDPVAGHIPGASNLYWKSLVEINGCLTVTSARKEAYQQVFGDVVDNQVVCYCGSGVTACHLLLGMEAAGVHGANLYVGSWSEWCRIHPPSTESK